MHHSIEVGKVCVICFFVFMFAFGIGSEVGRLIGWKQAKRLFAPDFLQDT
jgi:hypothetical protein